ncbi:MAG: tetratricopeptide repeat protein [Acidobacteria bacterium]|nr:tetratricopeptide repeat protein [Acidobacteriota bacterium]
MFRLRLAGVVVACVVVFPGAAYAQCAAPVQALIADGKYDQARADVQAQLKRAPNDDAAMECMGRLRLEQGESADAVEWLDKAVKINGRSGTHHLWLGNAVRSETEKAGMLRQAFLARQMKAEYEQAVALDATLVDAHQGLFMFLSNAPAAIGGGVEKAREEAAAILKLNPARGHADYGTLAENAKDYADAEKEFLAAVSAAPDSTEGHTAAGSFYRRRQRWADAIAMYEKELKAKPDFITAHLSLGRVYIENLKNYDRGEKEVRLWLANPPKDASATNTAIAHYCLGVVHEQVGRRDQARAEYQAALGANPKNEDAKKALAALK